jgi:hypothetical protein
VRCAQLTSSTFARPRPASHEALGCAAGKRNNPIADGVMDLLSEEQRREIACETRRGRMQRARSGRVVASVPPYGFKFNHDNTNFVVEEAGAAVVSPARIPPARRWAQRQRRQERPGEG